MSAYQLYYFPGNANLAPHILLEELGVPHELKFVDQDNGAQKSPEYMKLNPNGRIPTLVDGELVLFETAAICLHLCDRHPEGGMAPALGSAERAHFYKWLVYLTNTVQAEMLMYFYPQRWADSEAGQAMVKAAAEQRLNGMFDLLEAELAKNAAAGKGDYLLGERYGAVDAYLFMLARWTRNMKRPARTLPHFSTYLARIAARPAVKRTYAAEGIEGIMY